MKIPLALGVGDGFSLAEIVELAVFCDNNGYDSVWIPEDRLVRDAIVPTALSAYATRRVKLGTGVVNNRTRNAALMAVTFKTLFEVAPGRINLGIGAWWEPIASRVGTPLNRPLLMMREYIHALKTLFHGETLNFEGEFVRMHDVSFDMLLAGNRHAEPMPIPIYLGATGQPAARPAPCLSRSSGISPPARPLRRSASSAIKRKRFAGLDERRPSRASERLGRQTSVCLLR